MIYIYIYTYILQYHILQYYIFYQLVLGFFDDVMTATKLTWTQHHHDLGSKFSPSKWLGMVKAAKATTVEANRIDEVVAGKTWQRTDDNDHL